MISIILFKYDMELMCFLPHVCYQKHCKQHFEDEEKDLLPLIEATDLNEEQQKVILGQCYDSMKATHSHLFDFFLEGLLPKEAMQYLDIFMKCNDPEQMASTPLFR